MANYILTDLLRFSAGAILVHSIYIFYIYICTRNSGCMNVDAGDIRCHGRFFDAEKERMIQKASVNGCYNHGLAFASQRLFLEARMHH